MHLRLIVLAFIVNLIKAEVCQSRNNLTPLEIWGVFEYDPFERYFTLIVGSIAAFLIVSALLTWCCLPSFAVPWNVIFVLLLGTLLDTITLIIQAIYSTNGLGSGFIPFCKAIGFFNMLGNIICVYYNALFCGSLAYLIRNTLKKPLLTPFRMHLLCWIIIVTAFLVVLFSSDPSRPLMSICIYRLADPSSLGLFFLHLILTGFSLYSLRKFRSHLPQNSFFEHQSHFKYYLVYMGAFCLVEAINTLIYLIGNISCHTSENPTGLLSNLLTTTNVLTILLALASAALRLGHPFILGKIKTSVQSHRMPTEQFQHQKQQFSWVSSLVDSIKGCELLSFIEAIMLNYIQNVRKYTKELTPYHYQRRCSFRIDQKITQQYITRRITNRQSHFAKRLSDGLVTLSYRVTTYSPELYGWIFKNENMNLFSSFDLRKNLEAVKQDSFTNGGKSGQFFFGTFDHKFIFKTIQPAEAELLQNQTQYFHHYFMRHPESFLIKLLGFFKFQRQDVDKDPVYLIIMKNLSMSHKSTHLRVYDIKGSQFNRSTMKQLKIQPSDEQKLKNNTLKDKDFAVLERKIMIQPIISRKIKQILTEDARFLGKIGVMDYSLLIIKRKGDPTGLRGQYKSLTEQGVFYHFGIIDYLEEWTMKRKAERVFKTLITDEQVTVQSPKAYSERLIKTIENIFPDGLDQND